MHKYAYRLLLFAHPDIILLCFFFLLLQSMYINIDDFKSRLMVLSGCFDPDYQAKQVLNNDFSFSIAAGSRSH